jgi:hypothetical protein
VNPQGPRFIAIAFDLVPHAFGDEEITEPAGLRFFGQLSNQSHAIIVWRG